jgi:PPOX class probable F420-dependent enzyme
MSIASAKYVSLVTLRKSGEAVPSPVWIAPLADGRAGFTTEANSGKVKRIRNNNAVTLQECTMRGKLIEGAPVVSATAEVVSGAAHDEVHRSIRSKYGLIVLFIGISDLFAKVMKKPRTPTAIVITFAAPHIAAGHDH